MSANSFARDSERLANYLGREVCDTRIGQLDKLIALAAFTGFACALATPRADRPVALPFGRERNARLSIVRDTRELVSADFDGSKLGTVELDDGTEILVLVDVDPSPRGDVTFDAWRADAASEFWVRSHQDELRAEWDIREAE